MLKESLSLFIMAPEQIFQNSRKVFWTKELYTVRVFIQLNLKMSQVVKKVIHLKD